jgi:hypothetical protein
VEAEAVAVLGVVGLGVLVGFFHEVALNILGGDGLMEYRVCMSCLGNGL